MCVHTVGGLHRLPPKASKDSIKGRQRQTQDGVHLGVTPSILRTRYNLTAADVGTAGNNSQAVAQVGSPQDESVTKKGCNPCITRVLVSL